MNILVAVDIVEDQVVRLKRGELQERTVYGHDPLETALAWEDEGAEWLHVIDLDGATRGEQQNSKSVELILDRLKIPVQVGGGIRSQDSIRWWLDRGAARVCIGTKVFEEDFMTKAIKEFGDKLVAAVDARAGEVRVGGWLQPGGAAVIETVKRLQDQGISRIMFTDIERDGTLLGPNLDAIGEVLDAVDVPVIASGGVDDEHSIRRLSRLEASGLEGVIIGKALYSKVLLLPDAKKAAASV